jgi:hypothetical protein
MAVNVNHSRLQRKAGFGARLSPCYMIIPKDPVCKKAACNPEGEKQEGCSQYKIK